MSNHRSDRIRQIIDRRRSLTSDIQISATQARQLKDKLQILENYRQQLLGDRQTISEIPSVDRLKALDFVSRIREIDILLTVLDNLRCRFDRETLNIGVVGRMRQGKSTLLQKLSGLTDKEIPAQKGGACTAVRSIVYHHDGETEVKVTFHSEQSLLSEVIQQYWDKLGWTNCPNTLDEFNRHPLPSAPSTAVGQAMYKHLHEYQEYLSKYRPLLAADQPTKESISSEQIPKYVTQQRDDDNRLISHEFLAVKQVEIYCRFEQSDLNRVAIVDIPGLGDTKLGDEALMLRTLGQEVDIVIFVRRPDPIGDQWKKEEDIGLYDTANGQLKQLSERAFMVLNHTATKSDNLEDCERFKRTMSDMKVVNTFIVDCYDSAATNQQVLEPIISYALDSDRLLELDRSHRDGILIPSCDRIHKSVQEQLTQAKKVFGEINENDAWAEKVDKIFTPLWKDLRIGLESKLGEIAERRHEEDPALRKQIEETFRDLKENNGIPTLEEIRKDLLASKNQPQGLYERYMNEMRLRLSQKFISMDVGLKDSLDRVKKELVLVLAKSGRLEHLSTNLNAEFLQEIADIIPEADFPNLKKVIATFASFNLLYRGMFQARIRPYLNKMTPSCDKDFPKISDVTAESLLEVLEETQKNTVYQCEQALKGLLKEPSEAVFAIAEEFVDGFLWSEEVEWQYKSFLRRNRSKIWAEEFKPNENRIQWQKLVEAAVDINQIQKINN